MRIEMINENQIRCTLTKEDLANRHLKISELAYGSDKAKLLFREMMQQAAMDYGFIAEDIPLMIEAIPVSQECIVLVITKVQDPEELDTRFSKFTPYEDEEEDSIMDDMEDITIPETADQVMDLFRRLYDRLEQQLGKKDSAPAPRQEEPAMAIATFPSLDAVTRLARDCRSTRYTGSNSLYRNVSAKEYALILEEDQNQKQAFNRICFLLPEYGRPLANMEGSAAHIREHYDCMIRDHALQILAKL